MPSSRTWLLAGFAMTLSGEASFSLSMVDVFVESWGREVYVNAGMWLEGGG